MIDLTTILPFRLEPLDKNAIVDQQGSASIRFVAIWQKQGQTIEGVITKLVESVTEIQAAQDAAAAADTKADGAQSSADTAQTTADSKLDQATADGLYVHVDVGPAWTAPSGTASRATFATYTAPVISAVPTQAEVQAIADHVQIMSQRMKAMIDDLKGNNALT